MGVSVLPESDARAPGPAIAAVPLADREIAHQVFVATRADGAGTPAAISFLRELGQLAEGARGV
jgi:hypothetical protein